MPTIITEITDSRLDNYIRLTENQLANINAPKPGYFIAESPNVIDRALKAGHQPVSVLTKVGYSEENVHYIIEETLSNNYPETEILLVTEEVSRQIRGFEMTRGLMCIMKRRDNPCVEEVCQNAKRIAVLEDVVNPTNIGAIVRSAAALNMDAILFTRGCADPLYRRAARVSMGTVFQIPWTYIDESKDSTGSNHHDYFNKLKELGFTTVSMALLEDSVSLTDERLKKADKLAVILGTEGEGLCLDTIAACDYTVCIPMSHEVDSLNVAAASAVAFWELSKKS